VVPAQLGARQQRAKPESAPLAALQRSAVVVRQQASAPRVELAVPEAQMMAAPEFGEQSILELAAGQLALVVLRLESVPLAA